MPHHSQTLQIEISAEKLASLIKDGHLCAAHIRCLNPQTKQFVWQLCLNSCADKLCQAADNNQETNSCRTSADLFNYHNRII